jgi:hypothetical protein
MLFVELGVADYSSLVPSHESSFGVFERNSFSEYKGLFPHR